MGYLNNEEIIVDAILTKKGRQKLATGEGLGITKFALGDDEIDYSLYEPAHPKGSAFYDSAIRAIPITEASPDETQSLRYKLVTLPNGTQQVPRVSLSGLTNITVEFDSTSAITITPSTSPTSNIQAGYTAVLANESAGTLTGQGSIEGVVPTFVPEEFQTTATVVTGQTFRFQPNGSLSQTVKTTLTIYGNETGGSISIPVTVNYINRN